MTRTFCFRFSFEFATNGAARRWFSLLVGAFRRIYRIALGFAEGWVGMTPQNDVTSRLLFMECSRWFSSRANLFSIGEADCHN